MNASVSEVNCGNVTNSRGDREPYFHTTLNDNNHIKISDPYWIPFTNPAFNIVFAPCQKITRHIDKDWALDYYAEIDSVRTLVNMIYNVDYKPMFADSLKSLWALMNPADHIGTYIKYPEIYSEDVNQEVGHKPISRVYNVLRTACIRDSSICWHIITFEELVESIFFSLNPKKREGFSFENMISTIRQIIKSTMGVNPKTSIIIRDLDELINIVKYLSHSNNEIIRPEVPINSITRHAVTDWLLNKEGKIMCRLVNLISCVYGGIIHCISSNKEIVMSSDQFNLVNIFSEQGLRLEFLLSKYLHREWSFNTIWPGLSYCYIHSTGLTRTQFRKIAGRLDVDAIAWWNSTSNEFGKLARYTSLALKINYYDVGFIITYQMDGCYLEVCETGLKKGAKALKEAFDLFYRKYKILINTLPDKERCLRILEKLEHLKNVNEKEVLNLENL